MTSTQSSVNLTVSYILNEKYNICVSVSNGVKMVAEAMQQGCTASLLLLCSLKTEYRTVDIAQISVAFELFEY